ncbi:hypothetical protein TRP8649_01842 [Pelagimonas phthalicica]|uniref:Uncharacterized protein n=1 Tax=Pelagimonas phthalicica TaxID=1037362 RepID=A0A238JCP1_9RHOB|nr:hypothetical protein CLV87_0230 [Pelagimonas phthalicica]SMX27732.1 hypothetical protein TRP8649_01842 [Pelagimonas phthalicica]
MRAMRTLICLVAIVAALLFGAGGVSAAAMPDTAIPNMSEETAGMPHASPCAPPCQDAHEIGSSCDLCLSCLALRAPSLNDKTTALATCLPLPIPLAALHSGTLPGFDPPPPRA